MSETLSKKTIPYNGKKISLQGPTLDDQKTCGAGSGAYKRRAGQGGVLDMDTKIISIDYLHGPGYLNKEKKPL